MGVPNQLWRPYRIFIFGCALLSLAPMAPSLAAELGPDVTVRYHDLDLNTAAGAEELLERIKAAAASVCKPLYTGQLSSRLRRDACQRQLTAQAVEKVNRPQVVAAYESLLRKSRAS